MQVEHSLLCKCVDVVKLSLALHDSTNCLIAETVYIVYTCVTQIMKFASLIYICISTPIQEGFDGQMTEDNIEIGICNAEGFKKLEPSEVKDYLAAIL